MLALRLHREVRLQRIARRIVRSMPLRDCPIEDLLRPLAYPIRDYGFRQPDRIEYGRQLGRGNLRNWKMPDCRPDNPRYFIDPLLALLRGSPAWSVDRMDGRVASAKVGTFTAVDWQRGSPPARATLRFSIALSRASARVTSG